MTNYITFSNRGRLKEKREKLWAKAERSVKAREHGIALQQLTEALRAEAERRQVEANATSSLAIVLRSEVQELQATIAQAEKEESKRHDHT